ATPFIRSQGQAAVDAINQLDIEFNSILSGDLDALRAANPGVSIDLLDVHSLLNAVLHNPAAYGYTNTTDELIDQVGQNVDPNAYLFWDDVHPTTKGHSILADAVFAQLAVPEPASLALAGVCGAAIAARVWKRRRSG